MHSHWKTRSCELEKDVDINNLNHEKFNIEVALSEFRKLRDKGLSEFGVTLTAISSSKNLISPLLCATKPGAGSTVPGLRGWQIRPMASE